MGTFPLGVVRLTLQVVVAAQRNVDRCMRRARRFVGVASARASRLSVDIRFSFNSVTWRHI